MKKSRPTDDEHWPAIGAVHQHQTKKREEIWKRFSSCSGLVMAENENTIFPCNCRLFHFDSHVNKRFGRMSKDYEVAVYAAKVLP